MQKQRLEEITKLLLEQKKLTMDELRKIFNNISISTLRRDLSILEEKGVINKIYGGIEIKQQKELTPVKSRIDINQEGKIKIARQASLYIKNNDIIFIDSGTTTGAIAKFLSRLDNLTVITNNMLIIPELIQNNKIQLITLSGLYNQKTFSFVGNQVANILKNYNITKAIMGTTGFSTTSGITHSTQLEAEVKKTAVEIAQETLLLADHMKFNTFAPYTYCDYSKIDILFTDAELPKDLNQVFVANNVKIII